MAFPNDPGMTNIEGVQRIIESVVQEVAFWMIELGLYLEHRFWSSVLVFCVAIALSRYLLATIW